MTSIGLNTGLRALLSSQFVLDTVGHNIANANTLGYSRQRVELGASSPVGTRGLLIGTGVNAGSVHRAADALLSRRLLGQVSVAGNLGSLYNGMTEIESLFADLSGRSLGDDIESFFGSISELSTAPNDPILHTGVVQSAVGMTSQFNQMASSLTNLGQDTGREIQAKLQEVNELADVVAQLNVQIGGTQNSGLPPNDLLDKRDVALSRLAELVDIQTVDGPNGAIDVLTGGKTLVTSTRSRPLTVNFDSSGRPLVVAKGSNEPLHIQGGEVGGLLEMTNAFLPELRGELDRLAQNFVRSINRVHSTAIPATGSFSTLNSSHGVQDLDGDGTLRDELLSNAGLPFEIESGALYINVTDASTGDGAKHKVDISKTHTTVGDFVDALNALPNLTADLDAFGKLRVVADAGYGFDFSPRVNYNADPIGGFGSGKASLGSATAEPFALTGGDTLDLTIDPGGVASAISIPFNGASFTNVSQATAEEIASVINADPNAQAHGIQANSVDGRLFLQSAGTGSTVDFRLDGGGAAGALGWGGLVGTTIQGQDNSVDVTISGAYTGAGVDRFSFQPNSDGVIGTTPGLTIDVIDSAGQLVATLDVGAGYVPGTELPIGEGVSARFGLGELSATHNDYFSLDLLEDSDTTDVLVAFGMNSLLVGHDAATIGLRSDIEQDPSLLATSFSGSEGDTTALLSLLSVEQDSLVELGGQSLGGFFGSLVGDVGFDVASTLNALDSNDALISSLESRQQQVSGVNVDEELVDLLKYEQSYAAAAQYISVINQLGDELLAIIS